MRNNPYTPPPLIDGPGLFIGREAIFDQINALLTQQDEATARPFLLSGPPKIGKTALLKQIENGRLGTQYIPIYIDLNIVTLDSVSSFYWDLAHKIRQTLTTQKQIDIAEFNQTTFVAAPLQAFFLQLIKPASNAFTAQSLLLLFDNAHVLVEQIQQQQMPADLILDLQNELRQANNAGSIFALTSPSDTVPTIAGLPFSQWTHNIQLEPLSEEETHALVRDPVGYTIVKEVSRYIYDLTQGHPASVQKICHALYDYQQENDLTIITVADIVSVQKQLGNHALWETAVSHEQPTFTIQPNPALAQTIHTVSHQALWYKQPIFIGLAILTLVSLVFILLPILIRQQNQNTANALANITATPDLIEPDGTNESDINLDTDIEQVSSATPEPPPSLTPTATDTPSPAPTHTPTATITPNAYPNLITREQDGMIMVYIPEDTFLMGSAEDDFLSAADEQPQREVHMNAFYIDKFEVSIEQYAAFLNRLGTYQRACDNVDCTLPQNLAGYTSYLIEQDLGDGTVQYIPTTGFSNYPVNHISWYGAQTYCQSVGARLPTEAEWEYAARGVDGRLYPWGNSAPDETKAVFQSDSFDNMKPVDALPDGVSPFGLYNMAGSLWEWTSDWYNEFYYSEAPNDNPQGPETGLARVVRGGAWPFNNQAERIRATNRLSLAPDFISSTVGFRCARNP